MPYSSISELTAQQVTFPKFQSNKLKPSKQEAYTFALDAEFLGSF